jgi:hypothetical protein
MSVIFMSEFIAVKETRTQVSLTHRGVLDRYYGPLDQEHHTLMHNKNVYIEAFLHNSIPLIMKRITINITITINSITGISQAGALIQQNLYLISIDGSIHIKMGSYISIDCSMHIKMGSYSGYAVCKSSASTGYYHAGQDV